MVRSPHKAARPLSYLFLCLLTILDIEVAFLEAFSAGAFQPYEGLLCL